MGVNYKTVVRAEESGRITGRMGDALERLLGSVDDLDQSRLRKRMGALEKNFETLAEEMRRSFADIKTAVEVHAHIKTQSQEQDREEVSRPEMAITPSVRGLSPSKSTWPRDPEVVTEEPSPGDDELYGAAWPLVEEWRRLRSVHPPEGRSLSWLEREHRLRTLELSMMEKHELTLPPEEEPLRGFARRDQTSWRWEALGDARKVIAKKKLLRWVRRILTLGLWRR